MKNILPGPRQGFTLIELLVVVAIILILAGLLLPELAKGRERAIRVACISNERQLGLALRMYADETGSYPGHYLKAEPLEGSLIVWPARTLPYVGKNKDVYSCPANEAGFRWKTNPLPGVFVGAFDGQFPFNLTGSTPFSYGINDWGGCQRTTIPHNGLGSWVGDPLYGETSLGRIKFPSEMIALGDSNSDGSWDTDIDPVSNAKNEWPGDRHDEGANILFCDNHVENIKQAKLVEPAAKMRQRWNADHQPHPEYW